MDELEANRQPTLPRPRKPFMTALSSRLTYTPASVDGEDLGVLEREHASAPRFQQLSPYQVLSQPTRSPPHRPALGKLEVTRYQQNWLLGAYPDAAIEDVDVASLLTDEIADAKRGPDAPPPSDVLTFGRISDKRIPEKPASISVVAHATGDNGHILSLAPLIEEEWSWDRRSGYNDLVLSLNKLDSSEQGQWFEDADPITSIRFVNHESRNRTSHWILVQKESSTTICEPILDKIGAFDEAPGSLALQKSYQIMANPICRIPRDKTGGGPQCDVSFNPSSSDEQPGPPQLAIIDKSGNWTIWDLNSQKDSGKEVLVPSIKTWGSILAGLKRRTPPKPGSSYQMHGIMWLSLPKDHSRDASFSEGLEALGDSGVHPNPHIQNPQRSNVLVLCNDHTLDFLDVATNQTRHSAEVVARTRSHRILQMRRCPLDPSQFFVLTNKCLFWLRHGTRGDGTTAPKVVLSRAHHRSDEDMSLGFSMSEPVLGDTRISAYAIVVSERDTLVTAARFEISDSGPQSQHFSRLFELDPPDKPTCLGMAPVSWRQRQRSATTSLVGMLAQEAVSFYQFLVVGPRLDISSSLFIWSEQPELEVPPPNRRLERHQGDREKLAPFAQNPRRTFLIPDVTDQDQRRAEDLGENDHLAAEAPGLSPSNIFDLSKPVALLTRRVKSAIHLEEDPVHPAEPDEKSLNAGSLMTVQTGLEGLADGALPTYTLLDLAGGNQGMRVDAQQVLHQWKTLPARVLDDEYPSLSVSRPGAWIPELDLGGRLSDWKPDRRNPDARKEMKDTLRHIDTQLALSRVRLSAVPRNSEGKGPASSFEEDIAPSSHLGSSSYRSSSVAGSQSQPEDDQAEFGPEDPVGIRLRRYAPTLKHVPRRRGGVALPIYHWKTGEHPDDTNWRDPETQKGEDESAAQRKRKQDAMSKKIAFARSISAYSQPSDVGSSPPPMLQAEQHFGTQPASRAHSPDAFVAQPMSQVVAGPFGGRQRAQVAKSMTPKPKKGWAFR